MKSAKELFTNVNYILRLIEAVVCLVGMIFYHDIMGVFMIFAFHGWFFLALCYLLAYVWEDPNIWVEVFALGVYVILMLITAFLDLSQSCILSFVLAALMIADLVILIITKARK